MIRVAADLDRIRRKDSVRSGFSLMELFLVIAILSVITLISWPMLRRPLNKSVVQDAAQQLQRDLASTRSRAIESGQILIFQFRPGTATYYVGTTDQRRATTKFRPNAGSGKPLSRTEQTGSGRDAGPVSRGRSESADDDGLKELPAGTFFTATPASNRAKSTAPTGWISEEDADTAANVAESTEDDVAPWSAPTRFYPSGRSNPARVVLNSAEGYFADVEVQGLAGRIKIAPIRK